MADRSDLPGKRRRVIPLHVPRPSTDVVSQTSYMASQRAHVRREAGASRHRTETEPFDYASTSQNQESLPSDGPHAQEHPAARGTGRIGSIEGQAEQATSYCHCKFGLTAPIAREHMRLSPCGHLVCVECNLDIRATQGISNFNCPCLDCQVTVKEHHFVRSGRGR